MYEEKLSVTLPARQVNCLAPESSSRPSCKWLVAFCKEISQKLARLGWLRGKVVSGTHEPFYFISIYPLPLPMDYANHMRVLCKIVMCTGAWDFHLYPYSGTTVERHLTATLLTLSHLVTMVFLFGSSEIAVGHFLIRWFYQCWKVTFLWRVGDQIACNGVPL